MSEEKVIKHVPAETVQSLTSKYDLETNRMVAVSEDSPLPTSPSPLDPLLEIARGNVLGQFTVNKFGRNIEIDLGVTADIWDGGNAGDVSLIWVAPITARLHTIASTSPSDTDDGVGARTVRIFGLTSWATPEVSEILTLNTASPPVTTNSYVIIYRIQVLAKGTTNVNVGTITATAAVDGTVTAKIRPGKGQTQMAVFGIPSIQTAYIGCLYGNMNSTPLGGGATAQVDVALLVNPDPAAELLNFLVKHTFGLALDGLSGITVPYYVPKIVRGPAIIKIQVVASRDNLDVSAGFDMIVINN